MAKKFVFYDLDGTLVDTRLDIAFAAQHMVREICGRDITNEEVYRQVGHGIRQLIEGCLGPVSESQVEAGFKLYRAHYKENMLKNTDLYPGALELLKRYEGGLQAVITNKPDPYSTEILTALSVDSYFCAIIPGNSEHYPKKPDPAAILSLLEEKKIAKAEALFIGDSVTDFETAQNAGLDVALLSHGFSSHEELEALGLPNLVKDISELIQLLDQKGW